MRICNSNIIRNKLKVTTSKITISNYTPGLDLLYRTVTSSSPKKRRRRKKRPGRRMDGALGVRGVHEGGAEGSCTL
jgi:hypothetical protein